MSDEHFGVSEPPQDILLAIEQLISGERSISEFRDELLNALYDSPGAATAMAGMINDYSRRGLIPEPIQRLLLRDIDKVTNEEHPTTPTEFTYRELSTADLENTIDRGEPSVEPAQPNGAAVDSIATDSQVEPASVLEIGTMLRDRFEIVGKAAGGSMGVVYKAIDHRMAEAQGGQPLVAIKVLAPEYAGRPSAMRALQQEAAKGRYLNHPAIVRFLDLDRTGDLVFLVMEWLEGRSLSELLADKPGVALPMRQALDIVETIGEALIHAHQMGVTHADVKPGNVMLLPDGSAKLLDFGIARARGTQVLREDVTESGFVRAATPAYSSPSVLAGNAPRPVDDVFSLACLAYRLLSGYRVFRNKTAKEALDDGLRAPRYTGAESHIWSALRQALSLDENDRTPSVALLLSRLRLGEARGRDVITRQWVMGGALVLGALGLTAYLAPRLAGTPTAAIPEVVVSESRVPRERQREAQAVSPPLVNFEVVAAQPVPRIAEPAALELAVGGDGALIPEGMIVMEEGGAPLVVRVTLPPERDAANLSLVARQVDEGYRGVIRQSLRLTRLEREVRRASHVADFEIRFMDDARLRPEITTVYEVQDAQRTLLGLVTVRIRDDEFERLEGALEADSISFDRDVIDVAETKGAVSIAVWRFNPTAQALTVPIVVDGISADAEEDFIALEPAEIQFAEASNVAIFVLPLVRDDLVEGVELINVRLANQSAVEPVQDSVTVRILDTDEQ